MAIILQNPRSPVKWDSYPPLDPQNRAYQESVLRARAAMIRERQLNGLCPSCGCAFMDEFGCTNDSDECFEGMLAGRRRAKGLVG